MQSGFEVSAIFRDEILIPVPTWKLIRGSVYSSARLNRRAVCRIRSIINTHYWAVDLNGNFISDGLATDQTRTVSTSAPCSQGRI